ncbi:DMT family transporter [Synechococcus sp. PCC 7336]|uniref:DMT family transporter n=1 Tax=Synechococcus sp. PCC 7336 TaxID=195250 RepID=UPI000344E6E8|nr:DMT family transporter [Synechococcus sp. PCC 7336]
MGSTVEDVWEPPNATIAQQDLADGQHQPPGSAAFLTLCIALLSISFAPIFIRLSETELGANGTVFNRLFIFVLVFGLGRAIAGRLAPADESESSEPPTGQQWILLASVGVISILSLVLWAISLQYTTVAKSMLLNNLTPIFTSLGSWTIFGKQFDRRFLLGMAIALSGAIGLGLEDVNGAEGLLVGDIFALLSAVFLGGYFLIVEQLRSRFSATTILLWRGAIGSLLLLPLVLVVEGQVLPTTEVAIFAVLGLGLVSEGMGQRLLADCMDKFSSSFICLFLLLEPIVSAILAWVIFVERLSPTTWIGFAVVLTGLYLAKSSRSAAQGPTEELELEAIAVESVAD